MTRTLAVLAACGLLGLTAAPLGGCATIAPSTQLIVLQGDTSLDLFFNTCLTAYIKAAPSLPAATQAQAKVLIADANKAVLAADAAAKAADSTSLAGNAAAAVTLVGEIYALLGQTAPAAPAVGS